MTKLLGYVVLGSLIIGGAVFVPEGTGVSRVQASITIRGMSVPQVADAGTGPIRVARTERSRELNRMDEDRNERRRAERRREAIEHEREMAN